MLKGNFNHKKGGGGKMVKKTRKQKNLIRAARHFIKIHLNGQNYWNKKYVIYNQNTWCQHLKRYCAYDIGVRMLNYLFADLEKINIVQRYQRHRKNEMRGYEFRSTRIYLGIAAWHIALNYKLAPAKECFKMINAIKKGGQAIISKAKEWVTPKWMKEVYAGKSAPLHTAPDIPDITLCKTRSELDVWYLKYG